MYTTCGPNTPSWETDAPRVAMIQECLKNIKPYNRPTELSGDLIVQFFNDSTTSDSDFQKELAEFMAKQMKRGKETEFEWCGGAFELKDELKVSIDDIIGRIALVENGNKSLNNINTIQLIQNSFKKLKQNLNNTDLTIKKKLC